MNLNKKNSKKEFLHFSMVCLPLYPNQIISTLFDITVIVFFVYVAAIVTQYDAIHKYI